MWPPVNWGNLRAPNWIMAIAYIERAATQGRPYKTHLTNKLRPYDVFGSTTAKVHREMQIILSFSS